jgi:hypothetical protein
VILAPLLPGGLSVFGGTILNFSELGVVSPELPGTARVSTRHEIALGRGAPHVTSSGDAGRNCEARVPGTPDATAMGSVWCPRNQRPGDQTSFVSEISERFFLTPSLGLLLTMSVCSWRADRARLWLPLLCDASVTTRRSARCGLFSCPVASATGAFLLGREGMGRISS